MILTEPQAQIIKDRHRFRVLCIGRRGGKTTEAVEEIKARSIQKQVRIAYIAPTYQQARDIAWEMLKKELRGAIVSTNEARLEIKTNTLQGGESLIVLRGWESIETLRGQMFDFIVIDEVAMMRSFWSNWEEVIRPTLSDTIGEVLFISTPKGFNHFYDLYELEKKDKDYKSFHFTTYDNPHIPKQEIDKAKEELDDNTFAQEYLADFRKVQGLIYNFEYDPRFLYEEYKDNLQFPDKQVGGVDFGFVNPAGIVILKTRGEHIYVVDEWKRVKKTTPEIIQQSRIFDSKHRVKKWYPDPAEPDRIEEMKRAGLFCEETNKDVAFGISVVKGLIKEKRLFIADHCVELLKEFDRYQYEEDSEEPIKEDDHLLDALRYAIIGGKLGKKDNFKEQYAGIQFRDKMVEIWKGE